MATRSSLHNDSHFRAEERIYRKPTYTTDILIIRVEREGVLAQTADRVIAAPSKAELEEIDYSGLVGRTPSEHEGSMAFEAARAFLEVLNSSGPAMWPGDLEDKIQAQEQKTGIVIGRILFGAPTIRGAAIDLLRRTYWSDHDFLRIAVVSSDERIRQLPFELAALPLGDFRTPSGQFEDAEKRLYTMLADEPRVSIVRLRENASIERPYAAFPAGLPRIRQVVSNGGRGGAASEMREIQASASQVLEELEQHSRGSFDIDSLMSTDGIIPTPDLHVLHLIGHGLGDSNGILLDHLHPLKADFGLPSSPEEVFSTVGRPSGLAVVFACNTNYDASRTEAPSETNKAFIDKVPSVISYRGFVPTKLAVPLSLMLLYELMVSGQADLAVERLRTALKQTKRRVNYAPLKHMHRALWVVESRSLYDLGFLADFGRSLDPHPVNKAVVDTLRRAEEAQWQGLERVGPVGLEQRARPTGIEIRDEKGHSTEYWAGPEPEVSIESLDSNEVAVVCKMVGISGSDGDELRDLTCVANDGGNRTFQINTTAGGGDIGHGTATGLRG